jgi:hypothetical protein
MRPYGEHTANGFGGPAEKKRDHRASNRPRGTPSVITINGIRVTIAWYD